jgi:hypothetical protein
VGRDPFAVAGEAVWRVEGLPGPRGGQPTGMREVMERDHRHEAVFEARGRHPAVVVQSHHRELPLLGLDATPFDGEPVGTEPQASHQCNVLGIAVEGVTGIPADIDTS